MNVQIAELETLLPPAAAAVPPAGLRRLVLTGFMGAGKTTVGRLLASRFGWDFLDLDAYIERRTGLTVSAIFARQGEPHFRRAESMALASALGRANLVLSLGGGTPELLTNRLLLEQKPGTATVFLDAPFATLFDRCLLQTLETETATPAIRPLLSDPADAEKRFCTRQPVYRRLARAIVQTAELDPDQTVEAVLASLSANA